ncbi:MAG: cytochrome-c peroxidase [Betaproteobacteria bacterium]|nr:cytochrome-c peroxidase [Betaproteobacteria bacterium]
MPLRHIHRPDRAAAWKKALLYGLAALTVFAACFIVYFFYSWGTDGDLKEFVDNSAQLTSLARPDEPILPIAIPTGLDTQKVALGQILFRDTRLSRNNTVSCATCHDLARGGVDHLPRSFGVDGAEGDINTPTVYNSSFNFRQFWDGRAASLEEQAEGPILNPVEMASSWEHVVSVLEEDPQIRARFRAIYGGAVTPVRVMEVIAEFERSLVTPSRFDRWLKGDERALSDKELEGYRLFKRHGCIACHQGVNVGGNIFQKFGVMLDYFAGKTVTRADLGRFNVTGREEDKYVFKVPGLRNIALTAPYFHDASAQNLHEAVAIMGRYQLGLDLPSEEVQLIVLFLTTLTGEQL